MKYTFSILSKVYFFAQTAPNKIPTNKQKKSLKINEFFVFSLLFRYTLFEFLFIILVFKKRKKKNKKKTKNKNFYFQINFQNQSRFPFCRKHKNKKRQSCSPAHFFV